MKNLIYLSVFAFAILFVSCSDDTFIPAEDDNIENDLAIDLTDSEDLAKAPNFQGVVIQNLQIKQVFNNYRVTGNATGVFKGSVEKINLLLNLNADGSLAGGKINVGGHLFDVKHSSAIAPAIYNKIEAHCAEPNCTERVGFLINNVSVLGSISQMMQYSSPITVNAKWVSTI